MEKISKQSRIKGLVRGAFLPVAVLVITVLLLAQAKNSLAGPSDATSVEATKWPRVSLPSDTCSNGTSDCHYGSPTLADVDGDNELDVVAVSNKGHVVAMRGNGSVIWNKDIAPAFGMAAGTHEIHSRPAIADIDNDGEVEIAVSAGAISPKVCTQGGLIVLNHNGQVESGWPFLAADGAVKPDGCRDTIFSSPALGDLDRDGDLEIVAAGFDKRIYAWHHNGRLVAGFPPASALSERFPLWPNLKDQLADNTWASPALADLDNDGYLDIVISTGEGNFDASWGGGANGWQCPYALPPGWASGYCGGSVYAFDRTGNVLPGFPRYILEAISSSPAVADLNEDGSKEIYVGTSDFYYVNSPDHPTYGFRLFGLDAQGRDLPGWGGGKAVGGPVTVSPSVGDITGDGNSEIVVISGDKKVYAWHKDGNRVAGFPMLPRDMMGKSTVSFNTPMGLLLADYDGDSKMEIIFNQGHSVTIVDGNGQQLTATNFPDNTKPAYYAEGLLNNTPAVGDIDNDGKLELVATNSRVSAWDLEESGSKADWGMFKRDASGDSYVPAPPRLDAQEEVFVLYDTGQSQDAMGTLTLQNLGDGTIQWSAEAPNNVSLSPASGDYEALQVVEVAIDASRLSDGMHDLGDIVISGSSGGKSIDGSPHSVTVRVLVGDLNNAYLPTLVR